MELSICCNNGQMSSVCVNEISNLAFMKIDVGLGFRVSCRKDLWPLQVVVPSEIRYCPFRVCDRPLQEHITAIVDSLNRQKKGGMGEFITACATDSSRQKAPSSIRTWEQKITKRRCHKLCKGCALSVIFLFPRCFKLLGYKRLQDHNKISVALGQIMIM